MQCFKTFVGAILLIFLSSTLSADQDKTNAAGNQLSFFLSTTKDLLSMSHGGTVPLAAFPAEIPSLAGTPVANMLALTSVIRDETGTAVGIASELEEFPAIVPEGTPMIWDTLWTLMVRGRGSLYLYQQETMILEDVEIFSGAINSGLTWKGSRTHATTHGPLPRGRGVVKGGTGEFAGVSGTFQEIVTLREFTPQGDLDALIELRIEFFSD